MFAAVTNSHKKGNPPKAISPERILFSIYGPKQLWDALAYIKNQWLRDMWLNYRLRRKRCACSTQLAMPGCGESAQQCDLPQFFSDPRTGEGYDYPWSYGNTEYFRAGYVYIGWRSGNPGGDFQHIREQRIGDFLKEQKKVEGRNTGIPLIVNAMK